MLGDTEEAVKLAAFFRKWHLEAQLRDHDTALEQSDTVLTAWWRFYYLPFSNNSIDVVDLRIYRAIFSIDFSISTIQIEWCNLPHE